MNDPRRICVPGIGLIERLRLPPVSPSADADAFWGSLIVQSQSDIAVNGSIAGWPVTLQLSDNAIQVFELDPKTECFRPGSGFAADLHRRQSLVCTDAAVKPQRPSAYQLIAAPRDLRGISMLGAYRETAPTHMSGWWLYDVASSHNDFDAYVTICVHHAIAHFANLGAFIALPAGYRVFPDASGFAFDPSLLKTDD